MFKWYFIWRARRKQRLEMYQLDDRKFKPIFSAGFFGFLDQSQFWQTHFEKYGEFGKGRRYLLRGLILLLTLLLLWAVVESIKALKHF